MTKDINLHLDKGDKSIWDDIIEREIIAEYNKVISIEQEYFDMIYTFIMSIQP